MRGREWEQKAAGVNFTLTINEEKNAVNRKENRTVFYVHAFLMLRMTSKKQFADEMYDERGSKNCN